MPLRRLNWLNLWFHSLGARLTLWNSLLVLVAVLVALYAVRTGLRYYLVVELDHVLHDEAREVDLAIEALHPARHEIIVEIDRITASHASRKWHVRWLNADGKTLHVSGSAPPEPLSQVVSTGQGFRVLASDEYRCVERDITKKGVPLTRVRVGAPIAFIEEDVARLTRVLAPVGFLIMLLAPLGGALVARAAIAPLQDMIRNTEKMRPSHLNERLVNRGVGDELDQLAVKINQFLDQIALHLQKHRDYLANAAHELRSPLAAIQSNLDVVLEKPRSAAEYHELLTVIEAECQHLTGLVSQLLLLAESDTGLQPKFHQPLCLDELVKSCFELFAPVAEEKSVTLEGTSPMNVWTSGDRQQLRQLLTNLLDNAIKFTPAGGKVTVSLRQPASRDHIELIVSDNGMGIAPEDLPRVFDRFYQVERSRTRSGTRGNGLGLAICSAIAEHHHGEIRVESTQGAGSQFIVTLKKTAPPLTAPDPHTLLLKQE